MGRDHDIKEEERRLFRQAVADARKLAQDTASPDRTLPPPVPRQRLRDAEQVVQDMLSDPLDPAELDTGEELLFSRPGVQQAVMRKLRRGQYAIEAELDLHRMTSDIARLSLVEFLTRVRAEGKRCARIIHGKGHGSFNKQPVLKGKVNHWLKQRGDVLAFCSCPPTDGGTGAIYVLLKR